MWVGIGNAVPDVQICLNGFYLLVEKLTTFGKAILRSHGGGHAVQL